MSQPKTGHNTQKIENIKKIFIKETLFDLEKYFEKTIKGEKIFWDYVVLTASNKKQAKYYEKEINYRLDRNVLPKTNYLVVPDPKDERVGSGGATLNVIRQIKNHDPRDLDDLRILIIHSGGDSKRIPQYSACGKIFSPVQKRLEGGRSSSLFDEFMVNFSSIPERMSPGVLMLSGDVALLFNPRQIDLYHVDAAAISIKEKADVAVNHGVFVSDKDSDMEQFLHKQPINVLKASKAINELGCVDIDTGAIYFSSKIEKMLLKLIETEKEFKNFINSASRISLYADLVYPFSKKATLEDYLKQTPEGQFCDELAYCRKKIWKILHGTKFKVIKTSPSQFIHFGTTKELSNKIISNIDSFDHLGWKRSIISNKENDILYCTNCSFISKEASIGENCYIENSTIIGKCKIGEGTIVSNSTLKNIDIPNNICINTFKLENNKYVTRIYSTNDNPKNDKSDGELAFLSGDIIKMQKKYDIDNTVIWGPSGEENLWTANLFTVEQNEEESLTNALILYEIMSLRASKNQAKEYFNKIRISLADYEKIDGSSIIKNRLEIERKVRNSKFIKKIEKNLPLEEAITILEYSDDLSCQVKQLLDDVNSYEAKIRYRIYLALSLLAAKQDIGYSQQYFEDLCYEEVKKEICEVKYITEKHYKTKKEYKVELPVRANFAGAWSDTPPYCIENGGAVINAAFTLDGQLPIKANVKKIEQPKIILESIDLKVSEEFTSVPKLLDFKNPNDQFSLLKTALIVTGIVSNSDKNISDVIKRLGGGLYLSTDASMIPKGSGLGTSSILASACVKALYGFLNKKISNDKICTKVLEQEQLMGTGGGWQDQIGGLVPGIKCTHTKPGKQQFNIERIKISDKMIKELNDRYVLIYTGQRRLAKNLLRAIMNGYISNNPTIVKSIDNIKASTELMKKSLGKNDIDEFAKILDYHWDLSKKLDDGFTNTSINQIIKSCEDLIDAKMLCGAGGGGFLQVLLKRDVSFRELEKRINMIYQDCGVKVYKTKLYTGE